VDNFGILLDLSHLPLLGETFRHAVQTVAPYLRRVHLGNCVLKDPSHPRYGDRHPPFGIEGGEIDVPELTAFLRCLLQVGFLAEERRGSVLFEIAPWPPHREPDSVVAESLAQLDRAWAAV
jgi:sugar phosphate isomerase/epimerase